MSDNTFNLGTVIDDAKKVITNPIEFYRNMPTEGGLSNPLIFVAVIGAITGLIISVYSIIGIGANNGMFAGGIAIGAIIVFPIMAVIGSFIGAAVIFVVWKLMGSDKTYEVAYRCTAYSFAIAPIVLLISFIPYIAGIIKTLWSCYLFYIASIEVHKLKAQTAKVVFGVFAVIGALMGVGSEHAARNFTNTFERAMSDSNIPEVFKDIENLEDMSPEEVGEKMGEFMKGLNKVLEEAEREAKEE